MSLLDDLQRELRDVRRRMPSQALSRCADDAEKATALLREATGSSNNPKAQDAVRDSAAGHDQVRQALRAIMDVQGALDRYLTTIFHSGSSATALTGRPGATGSATNGQATDLASSNPARSLIVYLDADQDPGAHRGALGDLFQAGVHDPHHRFMPKEHAIAEYLATHDRVAVHPRPVDNTPRVKNPDAMIRTGPDHVGTLTEFKTMRQNSTNSILENLYDAQKQLAPHGGGDVVIDGRGVGLTEQTARVGLDRFCGLPRAQQRPLPRRVHFLLADGSRVTVSEDTT